MGDFATFGESSLGNSLPDLQSALATALQDRYRLERELGRGGMAVVYLAEDLRHERPVALKVLLPELAAALGPERFQREIKLAARLQHPHILGVHDSGEAAGRLWFAMPFVEGESLRDRLRRERQLAVDDALRIGREAAAALDHAHRHGVIHRDIKPENILLTADGDTLVADFGIARALAADDHLTQTGLSVGTPAYMSPEQAAGDKAIDARTDIYSLAAVVYEMLAGEPPFTGPTAQAVAMKRLTEAPPSVRRGRPTVPEAVDEAIRRALAPLPADRFATAGEFGRLLQTVPTTTGATAAAAAPAAPTLVASTVVTSPTATGAAPSTRRRMPIGALTLGLGFLLGLGVLFAWRRSHSDAGSTGARVLAVLPFENLGDSADAYFADGVTDEVRGKLARLGGLSVIARNSSSEYRNTKKRPEEIARELGADYLLTATVRWSKAPGQPSRVRVTPELVDVRPGHAARTQWQDAFDAALTDVFQVQADIAGKVASALDVTLGDSARRELVARPTANLEAYDAYLKGLAASQGVDPASIRRAIGFYEQAVTLDSTFLAAWARLARSRSFLYGQSTPTSALAAAALQALERARALGPDRPETYSAIRGYSANILHDNTKAREAAAAAVARAPNDADMLNALANIEQSVGLWDASIEHGRRVVMLDPRSITPRINLGTALLVMRRYDEAAVALDQALDLAPGDLGSVETRATVDLARGDLAGARAIIHRAEASVPQTALVAYFGVYNDLYWALDSAQQDLLLTLPMSAFDGDRLIWGLVRAQTYQLRGEQRLARAYGDTAEAAAAAQLKDVPDDPQRHALRGLALAFAGRKAEAIAEGKRGVELMPASRDATTGPYNLLQLVRIYILTGEPEQALDSLELLLRVPNYISPGWLRIDPNFAPLRGNPRFEKLAAGAPVSP